MEKTLEKWVDTIEMEMHISPKRREMERIVLETSKRIEKMTYESKLAFSRMQMYLGASFLAGCLGDTGAKEYYIQEMIKIRDEYLKNT